MLPGRGDDQQVDPQVRLGRRVAGQAHRDVGLAYVRGVGVGVGVHGDGLDAHAPGTW